MPRSQRRQLFVSALTRSAIIAFNRLPRKKQIIIAAKLGAWGEFAIERLYGKAKRLFRVKKRQTYKNRQYGNFSRRFRR